MCDIILEIIRICLSYFYTNLHTFTTYCTYLYILFPAFTWISTMSLEAMEDSAQCCTR